MSSDRLLDVDGVSAGYGAALAVRDVSFTLGSGQILGLMGSNGAGKTTLLRVLAGFLSPAAGAVSLRGKALPKATDRRVRAGIGYVPDERAIVPSLTVKENLRLGRGRVDDALDVFPDLAPLQHRRAGLLSGGEQQMLVLARMLAGNPAVALIDELSLGLAPLIVERLLQALTEAAARGLGVILVEQALHRVVRVSDTLVVMRRGRVVMQGPTIDIASDTTSLERAYLGSPDSYTT